ncbi:MAG: 2-hydroxyacyl-CoA dehydratase subunit D [Thermodesulfobacteriota bacterium]
MPNHDAASVLKYQKQQGARIMGCFPLYPPVALFAAMDLLPVVLWGLKSAVPTFGQSDKHVQPYACAVGRELMQFVLSENGTLIDGIFSYNACDTLRNFPEIVASANAAAGRDIAMLHMHVPQVSPVNQVDGGRAYPARYLESEIRRVIEGVENAFDTRFSPEKFLRATQRYAKVRALCRRAESLVAKGALSFGVFCRVVLAGYFLPADEQVKSLEVLIAKADTAGAAEAAPVMISGIMPPPPAVVGAMEGAGLRVAANDIASLWRSYGYSPAATDDPVAHYTDFFKNRPPCSTLLYQSDDRVTRFLQRVSDTGARGVIFCGEKFCEYEYFEYPYMEKRLKAMGVPSLFLEFAGGDDENVDAQGTRVAAFAEMLE